MYVGPAAAQTTFDGRVASHLRSHVLAQAEWAMEQHPATVTSAVSHESAGGKHDFFSEGDYWWPDSANPDGPYVQRDGESNPENFNAHRELMIVFSRVVGALASAYILTGEDKYVIQAFRHARAWFADTATMMNPSLAYAQAIRGRVTGRSIGIIDTIHLMEVAHGLGIMFRSPAADTAVSAAIRKWFRSYLTWLTTHPFGKQEMNAENNHGTCWVMQVAAFARLTGDAALLAFCRDRYKNVLLPGQMAADGSFPRELARTKPYGYSLFNLDAMAMICQILSDENENLWKFKTADGRSVEKAIGFMYPYIEDKSTWPYKKDVMYWDHWPVAHPFLVFGSRALDEDLWFALWQGLDHDPRVPEILRNLPIRNPLIWFNSIP